MRRILDFTVAHEVLVAGGEEIVHGVAGDEGCGSEGHVELVACAVIVAHGLAPPLGHGDGHEGGDEGRVEVVQRGVDVPAEEAGEVTIVRGGDGEFVEFLVVRVD